MIRPKSVYPSDPECIVILFDLREPEAPEQVHCLRAVWQTESDLEALGPTQSSSFYSPEQAGGSRHECI
jgi:hypothetical protein